MDPHDINITIKINLKNFIFEKLTVRLTVGYYLAVSIDNLTLATFRSTPELHSHCTKTAKNFSATVKPKG